ncbi:hypothetical protein Tco_0491622 [Tanacetum coccineum]
MLNCPICKSEVDGRPKEDKGKECCKQGQLQELWNGDGTKDVLRVPFPNEKRRFRTSMIFQSKASLLGGFVTRTTTHGKLVNEDTPSMAVKSKIVYVGHRRFLRTKTSTKDTTNLKTAKGKARLGTLNVLEGWLWWMFPFERYMKKLKNYVRNKAKHEDLSLNALSIEVDAHQLLDHRWGDAGWLFHPDGQPGPVPGPVQKVDKGYYEDLIETWRKGHSNKKTGQFKTTENEQRYLDMKAMKDNIKAGLIPFKTDQEILDEIVPSDNRQNMSGMGGKLSGGGSTSRRRANRAFGDIMTRDQITQMFRQQEQEKELHRKQAEEAQARAYLASLKADAADQRANVAQQNSEANNAALDLARENNNKSSSGEEEEAEQHTSGDDDYSDDDE